MPAAQRRQCVALLRKNATLQARSPVTTAAELALPPLFAVVMAAIWASSGWQAAPTQAYAASSAAATVAPLAVLAARLTLAGQNLVLAPSSPAAAATATALAAHLSSPQWFPALNGSDIFPAGAPAALRALRLPPLSSRIRLFASDAALESYIRSDAYVDPANVDKVWAAIIVNAAPPAVDYSLRFNASEVPPTDEPPTNDLQSGLDLQNSGLYLLSKPSFGDNLAEQTPANPTLALQLPGFVALQLAVDRYFINANGSGVVPRPWSANGAATGAAAWAFAPDALVDAATRSLGFWSASAATTLPTYMAQLAASNATAAAARIVAGLSAWLAAEALLPQQVDAVPFPTLRYRTNPFFDSTGTVFALFLVLGFLFPVSRVIAALVSEKEARLRDGLKVMGVSDDAIYGAWLATFAASFTAIALAVAIVVGSSIFGRSNWFLVFLLIWLFALSAAAFGMLASVFFSRARLGSTLGMVAFLALAFPYYGVNGPTAARAGKLGASICSPTAFALAVDILSQYARADQGADFTRAREQVNNYSLAACLAWLAGDVLIYLFAAWYLEAVLPGRAVGVPRSPLFLCHRSYWCPAAPDTRSARRGGMPVKLGRGSGSSSGSEGGVATPAAARPLLLASPTPTPSLGGSSNGSMSEMAVVRLGSAGVEPVPPSPLYQALDQRQAEAVRHGDAVSVRGLRKVFHVGGQAKVAVGGLYLDFPSDCITALLGHNGAGKTTAFNMAAGLLIPTAGSITALGLDALADRAAFSSSGVLGICPQHDVLWPTLTVREHLLLFAKLKGLDAGSETAAAVAAAMEEVGLTPQAETRAGALSGGQRRKLSIAVAFMGRGVRVVFLDEPTTGMDPFSRRATWELLRRKRDGRIIVLTTHFMDEADILGDRIAIMAEGELRCAGSPLFLKQAYGVGYNLTIVRGPTMTAAAVTALAREHVAAVAVHSDVASELVLKLSMDDTRGFPALLRALETLQASGAVQAFSLGLTSMEDVFLQVAAERSGDMPGAGAGAGTTIDAARSGSPRKLGGGGSVAGSSGLELPATTPLAGGPTPRTAYGSVEVTMPAPAVATAAPAPLPAILRKRPPPPTTLAHMQALVGKRLLMMRRDYRAVCFQLLIPALMLLGGLALIRLAIPKEMPDYLISTAQLNADPERAPNSPIYANVLPAFAFKANGAGTSTPSDDLTSLWSCIAPANRSVISPTLDPLAAAAIADPFALITAPESPTREQQAMSALLLSLAPTMAGSMYTAALFTGTNGTILAAQNASSWRADGQLTYTALFNSTAVHGVPLAVNLLNSAVYAAIAGGGACNASTVAASLRVRNHPLPYTTRQGLLLRSYLSGSAATILMIGLAFIPASIAAHVVREREVGAAHQQKLAGVRTAVAVAAAWLVDVLAFLPTAVICIGLFFAFAVNDFVGTAASRLPATITLFALYGAAMPLHTYTLSHAFTSHAAAQNTVLLLNIAAVLCMIASMIMGQVVTNGGLCDADHVLRYIYRIALPGFDLGNGLYSLAFLDILPVLNSNCDRAAGRDVSGSLSPYNAFDLPAVGTNVIVMALQVAFYAVLAITCEGGWLCTRGRALLCRSRRGVEPAAAGPALAHPALDADVAAEAARVEAGGAVEAGDVVVLSRIVKRYGSKVAVRGLSLGLSSGQVFGFLGVNGGGKSTTLKVLTGDIAQTSGRATIVGLDTITDRERIDGSIGYTPQHDPLLDLLTPRETLWMYALLKGYRGADVTAVVSALIEAVDLTEGQNRVAGALSGGNKRKLCVAVALMGYPSVLFLDEPSSGMDPVSQRRLWNTLTTVTSAAAAGGDAGTVRPPLIVLTTHSMQECAALCQRVGIMIRGQLACLGPIPHLQRRFGSAMQLEMRLSPPSRAGVAAVAHALRAASPAGATHLGGGSTAAGLAAMLTSALAAIGTPAARSQDAIVMLLHDWASVEEGGGAAEAGSIPAATHDSAAGGLGGPGDGTAAGGAAGSAAAKYRPVAIEDVAARLAGAVNAATVQSFVTHAAFPGAHVVERVGTKLRFSVPLEGRSLSAAFEVVEAAARAGKAAVAAAAAGDAAAGGGAAASGVDADAAAQCAGLIEAYSIAQMSLEQIFNDMAAAAELEGDEAGGGIRAGAA